MKISELFEGENSSLRKTYEEVVIAPEGFITGNPDDTELVPQRHIISSPDTKADWLRSEIEKLEKKTTFYSDMIIKSKNKNRLQAWSDFTSKKQALASIITRYKEELKVLESK